MNKVSRLETDWVRLGPSAISRLDFGLTRFANRPTYAFPWHGDTIPVR